jgi:hypothetical protein
MKEKEETAFDFVVGGGKRERKKGVGRVTFRQLRKCERLRQRQLKIHSPPLHIKCTN